MGRGRRALAALILIATLAVALTGPAPVSAAEEGRASWYGPGFHGNRMSNGQVFDMHDPTTTAANAKYPMGAWLKVTNPANGRSVVVQVRDRGAFKWELDLSMGAFSRIGDLSNGLIRVQIDRVEGPSGTPSAPEKKADPAPKDGEKKPAPAQPAAPAPAPKPAAKPEVTTRAASVAKAETAPAPKPEVAPAPAPAPAKPAVPKAKRPAFYTVEPGDTLRSIAERFDTHPIEIALWNEIENPDLIVIDQVLALPTY
ncbi:MAG: LysM peptidoglycan-binding domain-containing protein [Chloroflexi bacterium]|nr:LysM peptidoglycan-binding domain-containing protein [Chloroflexota bacterium]